MFQTLHFKLNAVHILRMLRYSFLAAGECWAECCRRTLTYPLLRLRELSSKKDESRNWVTSPASPGPGHCGQISTIMSGCL